MPIHDWTRVEAGIFHHFHHEWISAITRVLNDELLPDDYYALAEQQAAGFGPDVLTLQSKDFDPGPALPRRSARGTTTLTRPSARFTAETDIEFYRRKKSAVVVRHVSDDRIIAVVEILSPGNKSGRNAFHALIEKACQLLENKIHLLLIDLFPPTRRDPHGIHAAIWAELIEDGDFLPPADKPLTFAAYESALVITAFVEPAAVGDLLPSMPLILEPGAAVLAPLNATYDRAVASVPQRWRRVLEQTT